MTPIDVAIVGGGPAGLSAALMLGRCRRRVVVFDAGEQRNLPARAIHGYLSRDGIAPAELLRIARGEAARYPTVDLRAGRVREVSGRRGAFEVRTESGERVIARRVLLATGVADLVPDIDGLAGLFGRSVHHCPHCDAYEYTGRPIAVYGRGPAGIDSALAMLAWTDTVTLLTDGDPLDEAARDQCVDDGLAVRTERIARLVPRDGRLERIELAGGPPVEAAALFLVTGQRQQCTLAKELGCDIAPDGTVITDKHETTRVPGIYVAGDANTGEQTVGVAAAEGTLAAVKIHASLWDEDLRSRRSRRSRSGTGSEPAPAAARR